jgi:hypothetical protein
VEYIKSVPLWVYIVLFGFITFYTHEITIASDMIWYMNAALNIFQGKGYTNMDGSLTFVRGPIFPLMITAGYSLMGVSPWSAFWVVRLFSIAIPVLMYGVGKKLFNKWVGFCSALLILSSYSMNYWSYRHLDAVWPFFAILSVIILYMAFENKRSLFFLVSGLLIAMSYLVKQSAILLWPLPFFLLLIIRSYRDKKCALGLGLYVLAIAAVLSPWMYYVHFHGGNIRLALLGPGAGTAVDGAVHAESIRNYLSGLLAYYSGGSQSLSANFLLAPFFVCAWLYTIYRGIRGEKESILLSITLLLLSPYIAHVGNSNLRVGQLIIFLLISYLALAVLLHDLSKYFSSLFFQNTQYHVVFFLLITLCFVSIQIFFKSERDLGYKSFIKHSILYNKIIAIKEGKRIVGQFEDESFNKIVNKIRNIVTSNDSLMVDWYYLAMASYFKLRGSVSVHRMPVLWAAQDILIRDERPDRIGERPLIVHSNSKPLEWRFKLYMLFESKLIEDVEKERIRYVLLSPWMWQLKEYFAASESFKEVVSIGPVGREEGIYRLYRVLKYEKSQKKVDPVFTSLFKRAMAKMRNYDREKYEFFKDRYIYGIASYSPSAFEKIEIDFD